MTIKQEKKTSRKTITTVLRTILSLTIPMTLALFSSLAATFIFHANNDASYFYNAWYLFCKLCFPCVPLMMLYIMK